MVKKRVNTMFALSNEQIKYLLRVYQEVLDAGGSSILELGSGSSTVATHEFLKKRRGAVDFVSLDHLRKFAHDTNKKIGETVVTYAELVPVVLKHTGGLFCRSYDTGPLIGNKFDAVLIDGPSGNNTGRAGTLITIWDYLKDGCTIILDDSDQRDEQFCIWLWEKYFGNALKLEGKEHFGKRPKIMTRFTKCT